MANRKRNFEYEFETSLHDRYNTNCTKFFFCFQFGNQIKNWISGLVKIFNLMIEKLWLGLALELHDTEVD
jgi:hypothetical protein